MKSNGASGIVYLAIGIAFIIAFIFAPYPHYNPENDSWFLGTSIGNRILGNSETKGIPLDKVVRKTANSSVTSPLELECTTDENCKVYQVTNQCMVYCGNSSNANVEAVTQLNNQRVCDPKTWRKPALNCKCLANKCIDL